MHEPQIEHCEKSVSNTLERPLDRYNEKKKDNFSTKGIMIYLIYMEEEKMRRAT